MLPRWIPSVVLSITVFKNLAPVFAVQNPASLTDTLENSFASEIDYTLSSTPSKGQLSAKPSFPQKHVANKIHHGDFDDTRKSVPPSRMELIRTPNLVQPSLPLERHFVELRRGMENSRLRKRDISIYEFFTWAKNVCEKEDRAVNGTWLDIMEWFRKKDQWDRKKRQLTPASQRIREKRGSSYENFISDIHFCDFYKYISQGFGSGLASSIWWWKIINWYMQNESRINFSQIYKKLAESVKFLNRRRRDSSGSGRANSNTVIDLIH